MPSDDLWQLSAHHGWHRVHVRGLIFVLRLLELRNLLSHQFLKLLDGRLEQADFGFGGRCSAILIEKLYLFTVLHDDAFTLQLLDVTLGLCECLVGLRFEASYLRVHDCRADESNGADGDRCLLYDFFEVDVAHVFRSSNQFSNYFCLSKYVWM